MPSKAEEQAASAPAVAATGLTPEQQLFTAWNAVMGEVGFVAKTGKNKEQGYSFAGEADILRELRPHMQTHGLMIAPVQIVREDKSNYQTKNGALMHVTEVQVVYRLYHIGGAWIDIPMSGKGADTGDKDVSKALTGAFKYALRQAFALETGNDPDATSPEESAGRPSGRGSMQRTERTGDQRPASRPPSGDPGPDPPQDSAPAAPQWYPAVVEDGEAKEGGQSGWYLRFKLRVNNKTVWASCFEIGQLERSMDMDRPEEYRGHCRVQLATTVKNDKTFVNVLDMRPEGKQAEDDYADGLSPGE